MHNLVENPEALGFHQETMEDPIEQMETTEDSTEIPGLVCIEPYFIYSRKFLLQVSVTIQNPSRYFNVSGNIIK